jgi:hypothetical protein
MADRARWFEGKKFLWDGVDYETEAEAKSAGKTYADAEFDVEVWLEQGKGFVYTRRVVKEAAIDQN